MTGHDAEVHVFQVGVDHLESGARRRLGVDVRDRPAGEEPGRDHGSFSFERRQFVRLNAGRKELDTVIAIPRRAVGGPLIDAHGRVVGIATWISTDAGPIIISTQHITELVQRQTRATVAARGTEQ